MGRSKRSTKKDKSNFKKNMTTVAIKTTDVVFGVPHFICELGAHQVAQLDAMAKCLIMGKTNVRFYTKLREQRSTEAIETMENAIDNAVYTVARKTGAFFSATNDKVKSIFAKEQVA